MAQPPPTGDQWVPLIEGWRIIGRHLSGANDDRFSRAVASQAAGMLSAAARAGQIQSKGWRDQGADLEVLTAQDWQTRRVDITHDSLLEQQRWDRKIPHPDRIIGVVVDANDIRRMLSHPTNSDARVSGSPCTEPEAPPPEATALSRRMTPQKERIAEALAAEGITREQAASLSKYSHQQIVGIIQSWCTKTSKPAPSHDTILRDLGRKGGRQQGQ